MASTAYGHVPDQLPRTRQMMLAMPSDAMPPDAIPLPAGVKPAGWQERFSSKFSVWGIGAEGDGAAAGATSADETLTGQVFSAQNTAGTSCFIICGVVLLSLLAIAALVTGIIVMRTSELTPGPTGPTGPPGPPGPTGNASAEGANPFMIGNVTLEDVGDTVLQINGSLALPLTLDHMDGANVTTLSSVPNPGPGTDPLLWLETPGGLCLADDLYLNATLRGNFTVADCPDFAAGLVLGGAAGFLKADVPAAGDVTLEAADDLFLCTEDGLGTAHLNVGCSPRGPVELGEVQTVLSLDEDACLTWEADPLGPFGAADLCHNGTCPIWESECLVFNGTAVSFENGAYIEGDLFVSGNLSFTNMNMLNITQIDGDLTVTDCLFADCVVTNNLTVSTDVAIQNGATWAQNGGGSWAQSSPATFNNLVTLNGNTVVVGPSAVSIATGAFLAVQNGGTASLASGAALDVNGGAVLTLKNGGGLVTDAGAAATCAEPLFAPASGCTETCPDTSTCNGTFASVVSTNGGSFGGATVINDLTCTGTSSGCGGGNITCPDFSSCNSVFNSLTTGVLTAITTNSGTVSATTITATGVVSASAMSSTLGVSAAGTSTINNLTCTGTTTGCGGGGGGPACPDFSACALTIGDVDVVADLRVGQTGFGPAAAASVAFGTRPAPLERIDAFAGDMQLGAATYELLAQEEIRAGIRNQTVAISFTPGCNVTDPVASGCAAVLAASAVSGNEIYPSRKISYALGLGQNCAGPNAHCESVDQPGFPVVALIDTAAEPFVPGAPFDADAYTVAAGAFLDLQTTSGNQGRAELFATDAIDIGNGGRTWASTASPPTITVHGDLVCTGDVTGCTAGATSRRRMTGVVFPLISLGALTVPMDFDLATGLAELSIGYAGGVYTLPLVAGRYAVTLSMEIDTIVLPYVGAYIMMMKRSTQAHVTTVCEYSSNSAAFLGIGTSLAWTCTYADYFTAGETFSLDLAYVNALGLAWDRSSAQTYLDISYLG